MVTCKHCNEGTIVKDGIVRGGSVTRNVRAVVVILLPGREEEARCGHPACVCRDFACAWQGASYGVMAKLSGVTPATVLKWARQEAAGDFNGDGLAMIWRLVPPEPCCRLIRLMRRCQCSIRRGSRSLSDRRNQLWNEESPGIAGQCDVQARFGLALVAADFNGDKKADFAIRECDWSDRDGKSALVAGQHRYSGYIPVRRLVWNQSQSLSRLGFQQVYRSIDEGHIAFSVRRLGFVPQPSLHSARSASVIKRI